MHYYTNNVNARSDEKCFDYVLKGHKIRFTTDVGVFSKSEVDFGSRLLIENFVEPELDGNILDVGCGYGPMGLSLAKSYKNRIVHMVDVNNRALELAKKNGMNNGIGNVKIYESSCYEQVQDKFAAIVSNPPIRAGKKIVHTILEDAKKHLVENGELWIVIQKKQGAPSAQEKMEQVFGNCEMVKRDKGYYILKSINVDTIE
ncbi:MAG: class I SAM-dependent methyltransferase [Turicibacter sp.]